MRHLLFVLVVLLGSRCEAAALKGGAAAIDITPHKFPVSMLGSFQTRGATETHDRLHARCLVLDDGKTRIAFVICDNCLTEAIKSLLPSDSVTAARSTSTMTVAPEAGVSANAACVTIPDKISNAMRKMTGLSLRIFYLPKMIKLYA